MAPPAGHDSSSNRTSNATQPDGKWSTPSRESVPVEEPFVFNKQSAQEEEEEEEEAEEEEEEEDSATPARKWRDQALQSRPCRIHRADTDNWVCHGHADETLPELRAAWGFDHVYQSINLTTLLYLRVSPAIKIARIDFIQSP
jgi:hypothetical protein